MAQLAVSLLTPVVRGTMRAWKICTKRYIERTKIGEKKPLANNYAAKSAFKNI